MLKLAQKKNQTQIPAAQKSSWGCCWEDFRRRWVKIREKKADLGWQRKERCPNFLARKKTQKWSRNSAPKTPPAELLLPWLEEIRGKKIQIFLVFSGSFAGVSAGAEFQPYGNTLGFKSCFKPSSGPDSTAASLGFGISHSREFLEFWTPPLATL